jgi:hypothetical protein
VVLIQISPLGAKLHGCHVIAWTKFNTKIISVEVTGDNRQLKIERCWILLDAFCYATKHVLYILVNRV